MLRRAFLLIGLSAAIVPANAHAQPFVKQLHTKPTEVYQSLLAQFRKEYASGKDAAEMKFRREKFLAEDGVLVIDDDCGTIQSKRRFDEVKSKLFAALAELASDVEQTERILALYPEALWRGALARYEADELAKIVVAKKTTNLSGRRETWRGIIKRVNDYQKSQPKLPRLRWNDINECGSGPDRVKVTVATKTPSSKIQYVNVRVFGYCTESEPEGSAREQCLSWNEAGGSALMLVGNYVVRVTWPTGAVTLHKMPVDDLNKLGDGSARFVISESKQ